LFDIDSKTEYVETIIAKAIDKYIDLQNAKVTDTSVVIEKSLQDVVMKMVSRCYEAKKFKQV
jgi:26S proteasome regulatory subunit N2